MKLIIAVFAGLLCGCTLLKTTENVTGYGERSIVVSNALTNREALLRVYVNGELYKDEVMPKAEVFYLQNWNNQQTVKVEVEVVEQEVPLAKFSFFHEAQKRELNADPEKIKHVIDEGMLVSYAKYRHTNN